MKLKYLGFLLLLFNSGYLNSIASISDTSKKDTIIRIFTDFSPSFFTNSEFNPAFTGLNNGHNLIMEAGIDKPLMKHGKLFRPQSYSLFYDVSVGKKRNLALGIHINDNKSGATQNKSFGLLISKNFTLYQNKVNGTFHKLRIGLSIDIIEHELLWSKLTFSDMIDPQYGFVYVQSDIEHPELIKRTLNFSAGLWYSNSLFYFGFSTLNITEPSIGMFSVAKIPREFNFSSGGNINFSNKFSVHPSLSINVIKGYKGKLNSYTPALFGAYCNKYNVGLSYMDLNKIGIHAGCFFAGHFTAMATFAFTTNTDLYKFGTLGYAGGKIMYNFKSNIQKL